MQIKLSECFSLISKKKVIAAPVDVLSYDLGKFGMCLKLILKKKSSPANCCTMDASPRGQGNFGHNPSLGRFNVDWGNF